MGRRAPATLWHVLVRHADPSLDAAACHAVYAPAVEVGFASFEARAPTVDELRDRIALATERYAWLVAEVDGRVLGFAYASEHRSRAGYRWAVDTAIYVNPATHRGGLGRALYGALIELLTRQGLHHACAGIALPNAASVGLHEAMGFRAVGVYRGIGYKDGAWRDVGWWQRALAPIGVPPREPLGPQRLQPV